VIFRDRWPNGFHKVVHRCHVCGSGFVFPLPTPSQLEAIYSDTRYHAGGLKGFGYEHGQSRVIGDLEMSILQSQPRGEFLDVGAGLGLAADLASKLGWRATAIDYESPAKIGDVKWLTGDAVGVLRSLQAAQYDLAFMLQVIEHPLHPQTLMEAVAQVLKPGGICLLTTPNGKSIGHRGIGRYRGFTNSREHLYYFTTDGIARLAEKAGLSVVKVLHRGGLGLHVAAAPAPSAASRDLIATLRASAANVAVRYLPSRLRSELVVTLVRHP
jgi:2-polyprenyl-3-methyl-5-hydroxy-6-metoxy-1,4-benzoquinol methylase